MSKKVLFISFPFPPIAGGGVSRSVNLLKFLPEHGVDPIVVTAGLSEEELARHSLDESRLSELSSDLEVIRIPTRDPAKLKSMLRGVLGERFYSYLNFLIFPLMHTHVTSWTFFNLLRVRSIVKERSIPIVYTTSPPHNQLFMGYFLKLTTSAKWVCDLRDPYTDGYQWHWPSKFHFGLARQLEKLFLKSADKIIANTPEVKRIYLKRGLAVEDKIEVITNGF